MMMSACTPDYGINPRVDPGRGEVSIADTGTPFVAEEDEAEPDPVEEADPDPLDCSSAAWEVRVETVRFPARQDCPFSTAGNLDPREGHNQGHVEESHLIDLPAYSDLCGVSIASVGGDLEFDDHFTLTLDDWILVGGGGGYDIELFDQVDGAYVFDWMVLRGEPFANDRYGAYTCLGGASSTCVVPRTEERGPFTVSFEADALTPLAETRRDAGLELSVHTFGDNDGGDCAHTDIELEVEIAFVLD